MINFKRKAHYTFEDVIAIIHLLRSPGGCPWDQAQTHGSIRRNFLEETYEACEAIDNDDPDALCEELGDVLTQVVFHADLEQEAGRFSLEDVYDSICNKMIRRHPHIFMEETPDVQPPGNSNWDELKRKEKGQTTYTQTLEAVANSLPALWRAEKLQIKAAKAGFQWDSPVEALQKLQEEVRELEQASGEEFLSHISEELGDVLFAAVSVARLYALDPEAVLHSTCEKFIHRFSQLEEQVNAMGGSMETATKQELLQLWDRSQ